MAQRRMFSPDIVESDAFLEMPISSQGLYFHLGMYADDDGFVNPKKIMRLIGSSEDDLKVLALRRFIIHFESGVMVIKHWRVNNLIRKDWHRPTQYIEEKSQLFLKGNGSYTEDGGQGQPLVNEPVTIRPHSIVKYSVVNIPALPPVERAASKKSKPRIRAYDENNPEDNTPSIDLETNEESVVEEAAEAPNLTKAYWAMIHWAEGRRGFKFLSNKKQFKAFRTARLANIGPESLKDRWEAFEDDKFWAGKGFDWMDVVTSFNKRGVEAS